MSFVLLPSARLAIYQGLAKKLKVLPIKGEELITLGQGIGQTVTLSYQKTITTYNGDDLKSTNSQNINHLWTSIFNKKLEGLTHNNKDSIFVSDKFGDIYSIEKEGVVKYLNSNLGIPTFLEYLSINNQ